MSSSPLVSHSGNGATGGPRVPACSPAFRWSCANELVATALLAAIAISSFYFTRPTTLTFFERDPTISYQLTKPETVSTPQLAYISIFVPIAIILVTHVYHAVQHAWRRGGVDTASQPDGWDRRCGSTRAAAPIWGTLWTLWGLAQMFALVTAATGVIKVVVGRQRPNFLALCDYAGYRQALASGNLTAYFADTTPNVFGDLNRCRASQSDIWEGQKSFPSGHASTSFGAFMYTVLFLRYFFSIPRRAHVTAASIVSAAPLIIAAYIAISRIWDRWHNVDDVVSGSVLGMLCGALAWKHHEYHQSGGRAPVFQLRPAVDTPVYFMEPPTQFNAVAEPHAHAQRIAGMATPTYSTTSPAAVLVKE